MVNKQEFSNKWVIYVIASFHIKGSNLLRNAKCCRASVLSLIGINSISYNWSALEFESKRQEIITLAFPCN